MHVTHHIPKIEARSDRKNQQARTEHVRMGLDAQTLKHAKTVGFQGGTYQCPTAPSWQHPKGAEHDAGSGGTTFLRILRQSFFLIFRV